MKTIEELSELMFNDEHIMLLLGAGEVQSFLTRAVQHQFDDQATRYFFDKKNRELFKDNLMLSSSLYGDFGFETNLTKEQINAYKKRSDLIYDSPRDPDIIELPRLNAETWDAIFSQLLSEVGSSSPYHEQLLNNYSQYREGSSSKNYIRNAIMGDIQDETLIMNLDYLTTIMVNMVIFAFLKRFRLSEKKEDLFEGITVFELSDFTIFKNDEVKSMLEMEEEPNPELDKVNKWINSNNSKVSNWLWGISFFILLKLIMNYFN